MKEIELLRAFYDINGVIEDIELDILYSKQERELRELNSRKAEAETRKKEIISMLMDVEDKSSSLTARSMMLRQLNAYIERIESARTGLRLVRNQSMMFENYLFTSIYHDLVRYTKDEISTFATPYLIYTYSTENTVDRNVLCDFLRNEIVILNRIPSLNYIELINYATGLIERLEEQFM